MNSVGATHAVQPAVMSRCAGRLLGVQSHGFGTSLAVYSLIQEHATFREEALASLEGAQHTAHTNRERKKEVKTLAK